MATKKGHKKATFYELIKKNLINSTVNQHQDEKNGTVLT